MYAGHKIGPVVVDRYTWNAVLLYVVSMEIHSDYELLRVKH